MCLSALLQNSLPATNLVVSAVISHPQLLLSLFDCVPLEILGNQLVAMENVEGRTVSSTIQSSPVFAVHALCRKTHVSKAAESVAEDRH